MLCIHHFRVTFVIVLIPVLCRSSLNEKFSYYEILTQGHVAVRIKRNVDGRDAYKVLTLSVFGRKVTLSLKPGLTQSLLYHNAMINAVHANGTKTKIDLDRNDFHQGVIKGHPGSWVNSFYHEGLWTVQAFHSHLSFSLEPLSYHAGFESNQKGMVAYRHSDIRIANETEQPFCNKRSNVDNIKNSTIFPEYHHFRYKNSTGTRAPDTILRSLLTSDGVRVRRDSSTGGDKVCDIIAEVDYSFYNGMGGGSVHRTAKLVISAYARANDIFTSTKFPAYKTVGLQLRGLEVYTVPGNLLPSKATDEGKAAINWLKNDPSYINYCLVHVTAQVVFEQETLGVALTGSGFRYGICGSYKKNVSYNLGVSTVLHNGRVLTFMTYTLVLTHEIGHGFGSSHDEPNLDPPECYPDEKDGGKFIMWYRTNKGYEANNRKFSPCSIKTISGILKLRPNCLVSKDILEHSTCGNGVLDYGEDCDDGKILPTGERSDCCTDKCRFTSRAICSPFNHPCCQDCTVASSSRRCVGEFDYSCSQDAFCDGESFYSCPLPGAKPNGHSCTNHGECFGGMCIEYCSLLGQRQNPPIRLERCECERNETEMCSICCRMVGGPGVAQARCESTNKSYEDGTPCGLGYCETGVCINSEKKETNFWRIFRRNVDNKSKGLTILGVSPLTLISSAMIILMYIFLFLYMRRKLVQLNEMQMNQPPRSQ